MSDEEESFPFVSAHEMTPWIEKYIPASLRAMAFSICQKNHVIDAIVLRSLHATNDLAMFPVVLQSIISHAIDSFG